MNNDFLKKIKTYLSDGDFDKFVSTMNLPQANGLTINTKKINDYLLNFIIEKFDLEFIYKKNNYSYYKYNKINLEKLDIHPGSDILNHLGIYYIQEPSAAQVLKNIEFNDNELILDMCASPGGKSIQMLYELGSFKNSYLISNDTNYSRARTLSSNIEKMGFSNVLVTSNTAEELSNVFANSFDKILIDAPCSGEGMFRKSEEAVSQWSENLVRASSEVQKNLLINGFYMLKDGGTLIYSTCTYSKEEDEDNVNFLLNKFNNLKLIESKKIYHFEGIGEGQFYAIFKKDGEIKNNTYEKQTKNNLNTNDINIIKKFFAENTDFNLDENNLYKNNDDIYLTNNPINKYLKKLNVLRNGILIGTINNKIFNPSHAISHSHIASHFKEQVELDEVNIQKYLHGESIRFNLNTTVKFVILKYKTIPVGISKFTNNQLKNLYPKGHRIN